MKLNKVSLFICTLILIGTLSIGSTVAYLISESEKVNHFSMGSVSVEIEENFPSEGNEWDSGSTIVKQVAIKNTGESPVLVRTQLIPYWLDENDQFVAGDTSQIVFEYGELVTKDTVKPNAWVLGSDGFYYYTSVLPVGEGTTRLLEGVTLGGNLSSFYEGKKLMVDVEVEAIQATKEAYEAVWTTLPKNIKQMLDKLVEQ